MSDSSDRVLDEHDLEEPHIPVPANHAPRLEATGELGGLCIYEADNPRAHILAEEPVDIRE